MSLQLGLIPESDEWKPSELLRSVCCDNSEGAAATLIKT